MAAASPDLMMHNQPRRPLHRGLPIAYHSDPVAVWKEIFDSVYRILQHFMMYLRLNLSMRLVPLLVCGK